MADDRHTFAQARTRLEEIVVQVRKKDCSLEKSLDLLEEGVRLANTCTELSDHAEWPTVVAEEQTHAAVEAAEAEEHAGEAAEAADDDAPESAHAEEPAPDAPEAPETSNRASEEPHRGE